MQVILKPRHADVEKIGEYATLAQIIERFGAEVGVDVTNGIGNLLIRECQRRGVKIASQQVARKES